MNRGELAGALRELNRYDSAIYDRYAGQAATSTVLYLTGTIKLFKFL